MNSDTNRSGVYGVLAWIIEGVGRLTSYLTLILVVVIVVQVALRYVFKSGIVGLEELEWHLWGISLIFGFSYCLLKDTHIRMDLLYHNFSARTKAWLDLLGLLLLVVPFTVIIFYHGWQFTVTSWNFGETSDAAWGLPYRWIIKGSIPVGMILTGIGVVFWARKHINTIRGVKTDGSE